MNRVAFSRKANDLQAIDQVTVDEDLLDGAAIRLNCGARPVGRKGAGGRQLIELTGPISRLPLEPSAPRRGAVATPRSRRIAAAIRREAMVRQSRNAL